jgi:hypothetical protein
VVTYRDGGGSDEQVLGGSRCRSQAMPRTPTSSWEAGLRQVPDSPWHFSSSDMRAQQRKNLLSLRSIRDDVTAPRLEDNGPTHRVTPNA